MPYDFTVRIWRSEDVAAYAAKGGWGTRVDLETLLVDMRNGMAAVRLDEGRGVMHFSAVCP